ncbi:aquaporin-12-like [Acanthaster planci]|uniref:Aquaporin-12-like n=1 Tax=Acanthaster planci TaxID=133434 RepID=A0A8B7YXQ9_ACAPL|nr:aquaporin-12-like [Acanthaster planci]
MAVLPGGYGAVLFALLATLLCAVARRLIGKFLPAGGCARRYAGEVVCTFQLVTGMLEGDVVMEENGLVAYMVYLWFLFVLLGFTFDDDCSANLGLAWQAWLRGDIDATDAISTSVAQVLGGQLAFPYAKRLWRTAPTARHGIKWQVMIQEQCSSALQASLQGGIVAEALATLVYFAARRHLMPRGKMRSIAFDSTVQVVIIALGLEWTGMMFNPALAAALTFNCRNHPVGEHLMVYWVSPLATIALLHAVTTRGPAIPVTNGTKKEEAKSL